MQACEFHGRFDQMIKCSPIANGDFWQGTDWAVINEQELVEVVARVALGQARHFIEVFKGTKSLAYAPTKAQKNGAIRLLTVTNPEYPYQRDGWLFQVISWIAANVQDASTLKTTPHIRHADKGYDGLHLKIDPSDNRVVSIVICEEKATGSPRKRITKDVWPEFKGFNEGKRDNELVAETATVLAQYKHPDPEKAVHEILWHQARAYRVSITIGDKENSDAGRKNLFKGYQNAIPNGSVERRRAETLYQKDIRNWLEDIAQKAIMEVNKIEPSDV